MSKLEKIISELNEFLKLGILSNFDVPNIVFHGIAKQVHNPPNEIVPSLEIEKNGKKTFENISFTDKAVFLYHRALSPFAFSKDINEASPVTKVEAKMLCVVYHDLPRFDFIERFYDSFPTKIKDGVRSVQVIAGIANLNEMQVFANERGGVQYNLTNTRTLLSLEYTLKYSYTGC